ncbi:hypothetical protein AAC387_Pa07g1402 [Persea americana]
MDTRGTEARKGTIRHSPTSPSRTLTALTLTGHGVGNLKPLLKEPSQVLLCTNIEPLGRIYIEALALRKAHKARQVVTYVGVYNPLTPKTRDWHKRLPVGGASGAIEVSPISVLIRDGEDGGVCDKVGLGHMPTSEERVAGDGDCEVWAIDRDIADDTVGVGLRLALEDKVLVVVLACGV